MPTTPVFAFFIHPSGFEHFRTFWHRAGVLPQPLLKRVHAAFPPKIIQLDPIRSRHGIEVKGCIVTLPFTSEQILGLNDTVALRAAERINQLAAGLKVDLLGIGGAFAARLSGLTLSARSNRIPVTFGNALTAWAVFEGICRTASAGRFALSSGTIAMCDISNPAVLAAGRLLADEAGRLILVSSDEAKLKRAADMLRGVGRSSLSLERDPLSAFKAADVIVTASDVPDISFSLDCVKQGAVVFNLSLASLAGRADAPRPKITVIKAGLIKLPFRVSFSSDSGVPADVVPAAFAETILMAFEGRKQPYASPDALNFYAVEELADAAARHGLEVYLPEAPVI